MANREIRTKTVIGGGGVALSVRATGPEDAPAILLIHGWSQHSLCWRKQFDGPLAERFHLIAPDLRGHGASEKPSERSAYDNSAPWAADIAAIIAAYGLTRPLLVGWSMGGWIVADYLRVHSDAALAGVAIIGSSTRVGSHADPAAVALRRPEVNAVGMYSDDQAVALPATLAFVKACAVKPLSKEDFATFVGFNMLCPPHIRRAARERNEDFRPALEAVTVPAMVMWGEAERHCLPPMQEDLRKALPHAAVRAYSGAAHLPFWEEAERFDADLAQFADAAFKGTAPGR